MKEFLKRMNRTAGKSNQNEISSWKGGSDVDCWNVKPHSGPLECDGHFFFASVDVQMRLFQPLAHRPQQQQQQQDQQQQQQQQQQPMNKFPWLSVSLQMETVETRCLAKPGFESISRINK